MPSASAAAPTSLQLPRGGRRIFPEHEVVAWYGTPGTSSLGVLGRGTAEQAAAGLEKAAAPYAQVSGRPVLPAMELIATVAQASATGDASAHVDAAKIASYLAVARRHRMLLVLDLQPGRAEFLTQAKSLERFLVQPDVGLALDPEWKLHPGQRPLAQIGHTDAASINAVAAYVSALTTSRGLPDKLFVLHEFRPSMITSRSAITGRPGLEMVIHVDGNGSPALKRSAYAALATRGTTTGRPLHNGFKLFYAKDTDLMTPAQTMALTPRPELVTYQ